MSNGYINDPGTCTREMVPIENVLRRMAGQEGCDGEPYDQMQAAAEFIADLRAQLERVEGQLDCVTERLDERKRIVVSLRARLTLTERARDGMAGELKARDERIRELEKWQYLTQCHAPYPAALATVKADLQAAEARVAELDAQLKTAQAELDAQLKTAQAKLRDRLDLIEQLVRGRHCGTGKDLNRDVCGCCVCQARNLLDAVRMEESGR